MDKILKQVRRWLWFFAIILFLSGLTAIPAQTALEFLQKLFSQGDIIGNWLNKVLQGILVTEIISLFYFTGMIGLHLHILFLPFFLPEQLKTPCEING